MAAPNEIIVGPAEVYIAPVGTAFPAVGSAPTAPWTLVGLAGSLNYAESGVVLRQPKTITPIRALGSTVPRKQVITEQSFEAEFNVMDLTAEALALGYGGDVADVVVGAGQRSIIVRTDPVPLAFAILVRVEGQSPYMDGGNCQWQIYNAIQSGTGEGTFSKTAAFGQGHNWSAFEDSSGNFVTFVAEEGSS